MLSDFEVRGTVVVQETVETTIVETVTTETKVIPTMPKEELVNFLDSASVEHAPFRSTLSFLSDVYLGRLAT